MITRINKVAYEGIDYDGVKHIGDFELPLVWNDDKWQYAVRNLLGGVSRFVDYESASWELMWENVRQKCFDRGDMGKGMHQKELFNGNGGSSMSFDFAGVDLSAPVE